MNLINKQIMHKDFGKGNVVACSNSIIEINFSSSTKKFVFPDAFGTHLSLVDKGVAKKVAVIKEKSEEERKQKQLELDKEKERKRKEHEHLLLQEKLLNDLKISPKSQIAFWCNQEELDTVFSEWRVFTGVIKSGASKGIPKRPSRLHQNGACLLTTRDSDKSEKTRRIVGIYMVNESFIGKLCEDGYVPAHSEFRLRLSPEEAEKMLFWNYFTKEKHPENITWNTGRYRYIDNEWMAQILRDILSLKKETQEEELIGGFYNYFCELNQIEKSTLPKPNGPLMDVSLYRK